MGGEEEEVDEERKRERLMMEKKIGRLRMEWIYRLEEEKKSQAEERREE